jgi:outer membrane murein-binding lipoprotein Lpp
MKGPCVDMKFSPKLPAILSLALLTACSATKDMDQMSKTTQDMSAKTSSMADTTSHLATTNDSVLSSIKDTNTTAKDTDANVKQSVLSVQQSTVQTTKIAVAEQFIYSDGRQSSGLDARIKLLDHLNTAASMDDKIFDAGAYFKGMEYQLWKGVGSDDAVKMDQLLDCAMVEFVRKLADYLPSDLSKIDITATDQKSLNLFALSTGAQEMNPNVIQTSPPIPSMLDLIKHVISINADVNSGKTAEKDLKDWERDGLASYPELVYYLQVRENFLAAMTIGKINPDFAKVGLLGDAKKIYDVVMDKITHGWPGNFSSINLEQIVTFSKWLNEANTTATFLKSIGEPTKVDQSLQGLLVSMKVVDGPSHDNDAVRLPALETFKSAIEGFASIK